MAGVDDGIVSMKFDNAAFEQKLSQTIQSLDKLRQSLDFANSTKGMQEVSAAAKSVDLTPMANGVDAVSNKFLAMATIAITALSNIVNRAVDAGINIAKAFTVAPVMQGFQEYETNMNSIQTILSNTRADGTNLEQVNAALDQLNEYSDKTIYNFSQMARNIGTFTAAGVNLETAVPAIKGIANLAAVSGSNAEQASSAMYQLSQALASGTVKLIDWNSVVNAGMGGEVFQKALFNTGQMMGTLKTTNLGQTFEEWTAAGNTFRGSLQDGWVTAEVLTNTLQGFTGDLTKAQAMSMGYTAAQADEIVALGADAQDAATKVKTFTQLLGTVKESVATQWATTFRLIIGNFEEARTLFTGINDVIGGVVQRNGEARNNMLLAWKEFGGRNALLEGLVAGLNAIGNVLGPIKDAFRQVFPPMTVETLIIMTDRFRDFAVRIRELTENYIPRLTYIFRGFFLAIDIVKEVLSGIGSVIGEVFGRIGGSGAGGEALRFFTDIARAITNFHELMVTDGAIQRFFYDLQRLIQNPLHGLQRLQNRFDDIFGNVPGAGVASDAIGGLAGRFQMLRDAVSRIGDAWDWLGDKLSRFGEIFDGIGRAIGDFFSGLADRLRDIFSADDFEPAVDALNVGLLGGVIVMIQRLMNMFQNFEIGGDFGRTIRSALDGVTESLQAMQANLQSRTLMNIAIAIGLLTASLVVLSMIESEALARSLAVVAVGLGQLITAMQVMSGTGGATGMARMNSMATTMILMAVAVGLLAASIAILGNMDPQELMQGLVGVGIALGILTVAMNNMAANTVGMVRGAIAMSAMAGSLILLSLAVKAFSMMSWSEMAQGLIGVGVGLGIMVTALNYIPTSQLAITGGGILLIAGAMVVLAFAVKQFAEMSWAEMGQGLLGIAGGLGAIVLAMRLMPTEQLSVSAAGLLLMSAALYVMAQAVRVMSDMDFGEMVQGVGGLSAMLFILALAMHVMNGTAAGAGALIVVAGALVILTGVLKELAQLSLGELAMGLGAMAAVFVIIGLAAGILGPIVPVILGLGIALSAIGIAFALFGAGAYLVASAFEALARAGQAGVEVLISVLTALIEALPGFVGALVRAVISMAADFIDAIPVLLEALEAVAQQLIESATRLIPAVQEMVVVAITALLRTIRELFPEFVTTGFELLMSLLNGIEQNIGEIVTTVANIVTGFLDAMALKVPEIIDSGYNLVMAIITGIIEKLVDVHTLFIDKGRELLGGLFDGIREVATNIWTWFTELPGTLLGLLPELLTTLLPKGVELITGLLTGIIEKVVDIVTWFIELPGEVLEWIGDLLPVLLPKGADLLIGLLQGITDKVGDILSFFTGLPGDVLGWIGDLAGTLRDKGVALIGGLLVGAITKVNDLLEWVSGLPGRLIDRLGNLGSSLLNVGRDVMQGLWDGLKDVWEDVKDWLSGLNPANWFNDINPYKGHAVTNLVTTGQAVMQGLGNGMQDGWMEVANWLQTVDPSEYLNPTSVDGMNAVFASLVEDLERLDEFELTITPVLDLTRVEQQAGNLDSMFATTPVTPEVSYTNARNIAHTTEIDREATAEPLYTGPQEVQFIQNNYSPQALSTNDIYRGTSSQLALAKEELGIT